MFMQSAHLPDASTLIPSNLPHLMQDIPLSFTYVYLLLCMSMSRPATLYTLVNCLRLIFLFPI